mgnify:FL=1
MELDVAIVEQLAKSQEGTTLALSAVAEQLQKLNTRLEKEDVVDEDAAKEAEKAAAEEEEKAFKKSIVTDVIAALKEGGLMDLNAKKEVKVGGKDKWPMSGRPAAEDEEKTTKVRTETGEVQKPIQAMKKAADLEEEEKDKELMPGEEMEEKGVVPPEEMVPEEDEDKDGSEEYPQEMKAVISKMKADFKKQLASFQKSMETNIKKETESRMRKMGFREERGLASPKIRSLGVDETPIVKAQKASSPEEMANELSKLSYKQINRLRFQMEAGDTTGVPRELLQ